MCFPLRLSLWLTISFTQHNAMAPCQDCQDIAFASQPNEERDYVLKESLDVLERSAHDDIRLQIHSGRTVRYITLSYCWGSRHPIKTTLENLRAHQERIPFRDLPLSFQDVVTICRRLDIQYLWIDSLCIIQDSQEDWATQSAMMADIYQGAYFTLALASGEDSHQPILSQRKQVPSIKLPGVLSNVHLRIPTPVVTDLESGSAPSFHWGIDSFYSDFHYSFAARPPRLGVPRASPFPKSSILYCLPVLLGMPGRPL